MSLNYILLLLVLIILFIVQCVLLGYEFIHLYEEFFKHKEHENGKRD